MKNIKNLSLMTSVLIILVFAFFVSVPAVVSAAQETRLSSDTGENGEPSIYGDKVVWSYWDKIHLYDLKTGNDTTISSPANYTSLNAAIYGNKIVCTLVNENSNDVYSLCVYDIPTSSSLLITENGSSWTIPAIYGDRIVWSAEKNGMINIYMYDLSTQKGNQITTSGHAKNPDIYGDIIVWEDNGRNGTAIDKNNNVVSKSDIYMYDLSAKKESRITTSGFALNPAIYGDRIVWQDNRSLDFDFGRGMRDIYMYDLSTEKESRISYSEQSSPSSPPAIYGDRIVWQDRRDGDSDIYMYDLSTQKETQITTSGYAMDPDIYGDIIVDRDNRAGYPSGDGYLCDIYMYNLNVGLIKPQAEFVSNVTSGVAPLVVLFTDTSTGGTPTSWNWSFGDGIFSNHAETATHTFTKPGNYTVSLTVENTAGNSTLTKPDYIIVTDSVATDPNSPTANFSSNITEGYAPLTVQFYDYSQNATSRFWDFNNDGQADSNDTSPVYAYTASGIYTVNLTVSNANGTSSKTSTITVKESSSSDVGDSSGGSSHSSSSGGSSGGGGGSPEPAKNVDVKELSQVFITSGKTTKFDFTKSATCVVYVSFDSMKTLGKTTTIAEVLKGKSALVSELPAGEVYKSFNVWVGNGGVASSKNIENPVICFKVEKSWLQNKSIDPTSITLNWYNEKKWEQIPVNASGEDDKFLYFTANVSEYSSFAITGTEKSSDNKVTGMKPESETGITNENSTTNAELEGGQEQEEKHSAPGFEIYYGIAGLLAVLLHKRK